MSSSRLPAIVIAIFVLLFIVYSSVFVVNAREQAVLVRFGQIQSVKSEPGIYFKLPFAFADADRVQYVSKQALRFDLDNIRVQVKGGATFDVDAFVVYRIADARKFRETVSGDRTAAESQLRTRFDASLRRVYGLREFDAALSDERVSMMLEVRNDLHKDAETLGLQIDDVRIRRTDLTQDVSQKTYDRMRAERLAEAELLRAEGTEEGQRRRAVADRQVVEIVAEASKDSEVLRGQGEAERARIFADAFSRDPAFFQFYRSMAAYTTALGSGTTTMVLSPTSDFFRYFQNPNGTPPAPQPGAPALAAPSASAPLALPGAPAVN
ncbi:MULTISPECIES: protease modulator HflC [Rhizobium]|uniref:Protein HflC n=1 Tax=Rhizobium rhododendri TaxID=2506430 RepID=A0ABY8IM65_9HYPH|nr:MULTISPECIES: protease modulator HflC [Rhizobium]MBZ5758464.1 protease modulator HflC [Rhizobium sp. VS19-DR96]MBZ5764706.1 protease modulator HflC [Rhizobium sp. VS19-DR129.2]MBZ5772249.1 protease modulator HflC [Rhizobium sp. VS19-DRK62.2]MBZ5783064.1 protease modulator HflC [Rhizobium sp. VS19-DR121]MBZ5800512.1 protease modulator HflC [Rhizobium sp. VS19-DR181]